MGRHTWCSRCPGKTRSVWKASRRCNESITVINNVVTEGGGGSGCGGGHGGGGCGGGGV